MAIDTSDTRMAVGRRGRAQVHVSWSGRIPTYIGTCFTDGDGTLVRI